MNNVCITIDTEGDSPDQKKPSYLGIEMVLPSMLNLFSRYRIRATFFLQQDAIHRVGTCFPSFWKKVEAEGHEIGLHVHGLIGKPIGEKREIILGGLNRLRSIGLNVVSFRGGRYHFDHDLVEFLEMNGIRNDSSVVPVLEERNEDGTERCNHIGTPINPSYFSYKDQGGPGTSRILELPINRYPFFKSNVWAGILTGREVNDEVLFDYFSEIRRDQLIVVDMHAWDGLRTIVRDMNKNKKFALIISPLYFFRRLIGSGFFVNDGYFFRLESFLKYLAEQRGARFLTIREAGEAIRPSLSR